MDGWDDGCWVVIPEKYVIWLGGGNSNIFFFGMFTPNFGEDFSI